MVCLWIISLLSQDYPRIIPGLSLEYPLIIPKLPLDHHQTYSRLTLNYLPSDESQEPANNNSGAELRVRLCYTSEVNMITLKTETILRPSSHFRQNSLLYKN